MKTIYTILSASWALLCRLFLLIDEGPWRGKGTGKSKPGWDKTLCPFCGAPLPGWTPDEGGTTMRATCPRCKLITVRTMPKADATDVSAELRTSHERHLWCARELRSMGYKFMLAEQRIKELEALFEHPNVDTDNKRYLDCLEDAASLLEHASSLKGYGEYAFGLAQELRQLRLKAVSVLNKKDGA